MPPLPSPKDAGTVIVGMSGGVDSAVAALLLQEAGFDVQGLFMSNWDDDDAYCTGATDFQDARRVCEALSVPLHRVSFAAEYRERVFAHFLNEYAAGRTPNPDVLCNREIKFGVCLDYMHRLGASWIATGHYARVRRAGTTVRLLKAADTAKDQSYFLHQVAPAALSRTLFPLGELRKDEVRRRAHAAGLAVYDKPDSTGICFIGERPFEEFLSRYLTQAPGPIETPSGEVIGEHRGLALYTLGQRSGLRIGGRAGAAAAPWFVAAKQLERNALIVVQEQEHPLLVSDAFDVADIHWLQAPPPHDFECGVKTRYRQSDLPCRVDAGQVHANQVRTDENSAHVVLATAARAVTPGQYAVFYDGDVCLGGGVIARRYNSQLAHGKSDQEAAAPEGRGA
ncbi:MAG TPA: tRNA 2-thiouridine(34) synthase MnmA [Steroidobacteraceae bacterium]|nr:tRNA 2-thiouridine(34) synthase MnmA [Steroidobacteraceae bacterium]